MGHIHTSASFYRRGIPNEIHIFGAYVLANYSVPQPMRLYVNTLRSNVYNGAFTSVLNYR